MQDALMDPVPAKEDIPLQWQLLAQAAGIDGVAHSMAHHGTSDPVIAMTARAEIEPTADYLEAILTALTSESVRDAGAQQRTQVLCEISEVLGAC